MIGLISIFLGSLALIILVFDAATYKQPSEEEYWKHPLTYSRRNKFQYITFFIFFLWVFTLFYLSKYDSDPFYSKLIGVGLSVVLFAAIHQLLRFRRIIKKLTSK